MLISGGFIGSVLTEEALMDVFQREHQMKVS